MNQLWPRLRVVRSLALAGAIVCVGMVSTVFAQNADLSVTKSGPALIVADTDAEYTVSVSNFSGQTSTATNTLTDTFPAELTFVSAVLPDGWTCTTPPLTGPNTITCTSEDAIQDESSVIFTFTFHVAPGLSDGTQVTNSANISHQGSDSNSMNDGSSFMSMVGQPPPAPLQAGEVLISEFRLSGPDGSEDDYIELYCNRDTNCDISGTSLRAYDPVQAGDFSLAFPPLTVIPARHYLLVGDSRGYSLDSYDFLDFDVAPPPAPPPPPDPPFYLYDNEGIQLIGSDEPTVIDSVGFAGGGNDAQYIEGEGLQRASSRPLDQYAYVRKRTMSTNGLPQDTNNNSSDFVLVSVTGSLHPGITNPPVLGAPGPQGIYSPISLTNTQLTASLTDPTKSKEEDPNRVRVGEGNSGQLSLRRSFTNNTSFNEFFYIRFRVIETSTLNSPNNLGEPQADLRLISSSGTTAEVPGRGTVTIFGTVLEYDDLCPCAKPQQPDGGGLNTSVYVDPDSNESYSSPFDAQFLFNVITAGAYRFYVYAEAIPYDFLTRSTAELTSSPGTFASRARTRKTTPRKFASAKRTPLATTKQTQRTPVLRPMTGTSATPVTSPVPSPATPALTRLTAPRVIIINRGIAEGEKPRKKKRVRRKSSAALKKKAEEKFAVAAEKPQN